MLREQAEGKQMSQATDNDMNSMAWRQKVNAYEIYVNSFQDSDGDGFGDLNGIRWRLDHPCEIRKYLSKKRLIGID